MKLTTFPSLLIPYYLLCISVNNKIIVLGSETTSEMDFTPACSNDTLTKCPCPTFFGRTHVLCGNEISGDSTICLPEGVYVCEKEEKFACLHEKLGDCSASNKYCDYTRDLSSLGLKTLMAEDATRSLEHVEPPRKTKILGKDGSRACYSPADGPHPLPSLELQGYYIKKNEEGIGDPRSLSE
jgi:hypothetical protein